jgi:hypothetical protein
MEVAAIAVAMDSGGGFHAGRLAHTAFAWAILPAVDAFCRTPRGRQFPYHIDNLFLSDYFAFWPIAADFPQRPDGQTLCREGGELSRPQQTTLINGAAILMLDLLSDLWAFMRVRKKFWLLPIIMVLLLLGGLLFLAQGSALAPFIYTLF